MAWTYDFKPDSPGSSSGMATVSRIVWLLVAVGLAQVVNMLWGA